MHVATYWAWGDWTVGVAFISAIKTHVLFLGPLRVALVGR